MARPKKVVAQSRLEIKNKYDAAGTGRRMRGWSAPSTGPNKALTGLTNIRNRSRDATRNDWSGESSSQKWATSLVGVGITPRLRQSTTMSKERKLELGDMWREWVEVADADNVLNFYGLQTLAVRSWLDSGEVFVRRRVRRLDSGMNVPMQVQLIEPDFVPLFDADTWPGMPTGNKIRSGIERDRRGQRVAYWLHREHPGDETSASMQNLLRISADEISHVFEPKRAGQLRGVSALAPVLARLRNIADYDDAVLERQKLANLFTVFITRSMGSDLDGDVDPSTNLPYQMDGGDALTPMMPGASQVLDAGEDVKFSNPPEAGTTFSDYMRTQHLGTAAASGMPYELFSGDIKEVSDRTLRVLINEFRRFAEQRQWQIIIPMFCQRVRKWWVDAAYIAGQVQESELRDATLVEWAPHGWAYIHPVQDPQGKKLEVDAGFRSRSSVIGERGDDPDAVDDERAADLQREKDLDLWVDPNPAPAADPNDDPMQQEQKQKQANALGEAQINLFNAQAGALRATPAEPVIVNITNAQPAVNVSNHVPVPDVVVNNSLASPEVTVHNNVPVPDVTVNNSVASPDVNVVNQVQPSEVNVHLPARKTESTVSYNSKGEIVNVSQIESDLDEAQD